LPPAKAQASRVPATRPPTKVLPREPARQAFFTQVAPAVSNRRHNRLMIVVPVLLLVFILVLVLAYVANK
jgi:hypothetical protein